MTPFERLHPALRHHIVNSLGWRSLRPFQESVIEPILAGEHLVVLAPTAGGKTEAGFFPLLSQMLTENWDGLSILYLCPIKALLNNLETRLTRYCSLVGRRSALWHGDVTAPQRRKLLREPPDCLLTTPESIEVMLVSPNGDSQRLFAGVRAVVVDEIHAFAGDDRGWHLLAVLERVARIAGREIQRVGLSATVGNPDQLLDWLAGPCSGQRRVVRPSESVTTNAEVQLDYVGSLSNAATVISRIHRGEKRLVFVDSRSRAEQLGVELRQRDVTTFVTHSSLAKEQRLQAEEAFASRDDCVIVATGVLELGVDVGDLDRVIQIDCPPTVSSFLQRMGRTGRRSETARNCLFLATRDDALLQAAGLIRLWETGYVEPVVPPQAPYHLLAQQLMALSLQCQGIGLRDWQHWIGRVPAFASMPQAQIEAVIGSMLERDILWEEAGVLGISRSGESRYGRRHFMELMSVFLSPPLFTVLHGRRELGQVDELTFLGKTEGRRVLSLGGRAWQVTHVNWAKHVAHVEPSAESGRSRWKGEGRALGYSLANSIKGVLSSGDQSDRWSRRASEQLDQLRADFDWLRPEESALVLSAEETTWWTFAGSRANACLLPALSSATQCKVEYDGFALRWRQTTDIRRILSRIQDLCRRERGTFLPEIDETAISQLKFSDCLPKRLALQLLQERMTDVDALQRLLDEPVHAVALSS